MKIPVSEKLSVLAKMLGKNLYVVGGYVRNFLINGMVSKDVDLSSPTPENLVESAVKELGGKVLGTYPRTGTVLFAIDGQKYEYTRFRKDGYSAGGIHTPEKVEFTDEILQDALRRDFKCNAVYYDILKEEIVDPLDGVQDIKNKVLDTVKNPDEVFSHDGLRLLRFARFCGELGFTPTEKVISGASKNASNIKDISKERIWCEIKSILQSDSKYPFSDKAGHYTGLKILDETGVLDFIIPELTKGRGMEQRKDYHKYDVLTHTLKCVLYADESVRIPALLHDVGKPYQLENTGKYHGHDLVGSKIAKSLLTRLKADKNTIELTAKLTKYHMLDMDCKMGDSKVKNFILKNLDIFDRLLLLKQADYSACKDQLDECKTVTKWKNIYANMLKEKVPFSIKDLTINATDLIEMGFRGEEIGKALKKLLEICQQKPHLNERIWLLDRAKRLK